MDRIAEILATTEKLIDGRVSYDDMACFASNYTVYATLLETILVSRHQHYDDKHV